VPASSNKAMVDILAALPEFRQVAPARLQQLARHAELRHAAKDTRLYERGDPSTGCFALIRGLVALSLSAPGGTAKVLRLVQPGETFAESVMFDPRPHPVSALALADSQVVFLPAQAVSDLIEHDRTFMRAMLASLSQRIHMLITDIEGYSLASGTQRVAAYLHGLADPPSSSPARVRLPANKTVIASRLGVTKETFSRLLHELSSQGLIEVCQREVVLRDPLRLSQLAQGVAKS
jgi:CRP-like cAMP-binding protein